MADKNDPKEDKENGAEEQQPDAEAALEAAVAKRMAVSVVATYLP